MTPTDTLREGGLSEGFGAGAEVGVTAPCWCRACAPVAVMEPRFVVCPVCGDKRCLHAYNHEAPCAKADLFAHNAWVERIVLRTAINSRDGPPLQAVIGLGAFMVPPC
jgi:hypothetical protein